MTSVSASGDRSPVRLCRIVPQTNDPPAWLKAGRAFSFLAALTPRPLRRSIVTVRIPRPSSPLGFRSTGFGASVIVFPVIALQGRQIAFERPCGHPRTSRTHVLLQGRQIAFERPCGHPRTSRTHVLLQGRQIAFERPCGHPRTSRSELSGEARNCHLKPSNRSSDSLNDMFSSPIRRSTALSSGSGCGGSGQACARPMEPCISRCEPWKPPNRTDLID